MAKDVGLPEGFVLDEQSSAELPTGFALDETPASNFANMAPAEVVRGAAVGRISRPQAEEYLRSVALDPAMIDRFGEGRTADKLMGLAQMPAQGLTYGFGEEIASRALAPATAALSGGVLTREQAQQAIQDKMRTQMDVARAQAPVASFAGEIGGAIAGGSLLTKAIPAGIKGVLSNVAAKGVLPRAAIGGGVGAVSGGLYGMGTSEGDIEQRMQQGAETGGLGAAFGIALPAVGAAVRPLTQKVMLWKAARKGTVPTNIRELAETTVEQPRTPEMPEAVLGKVQSTLKTEYGKQAEDVAKAVVKEGSLLDTYNSKIRQLAKGAAQYAGGQEVLEDYFSKRIPQSYDDVMRSVGKNISSDAAFYATADDLVQAGRAKAAPLYDEAYRAIVPDNVVTKKLYEMPEISKALDKAYAQYPSELQNVARNSVKALDYAKRALDDEIQTAKRAGENNLARARTSVKNQLLEALDNVSPAYKEARKASGDYLSVQSAMDAGKDFMKQDVELLAKSFKGLPKPEQDAFRIGVGKAIRDIVDKSREGRNPYSAIAGSEANRKRLAAVLSPEQYKNFMSDMKATDRIYRLRNEVLGGSPTASKQVAREEIAQMGAEMAINPQMGFVSGIGNFIRKRFDGLNDEVARKLAEAITEERPEKKLALFEGVVRGKGLTREQRDLAKRAFVVTDKSFSEWRNGLSQAGGVAAAKGTEKPQSIQTEQPEPVIKEQNNTSFNISPTDRDALIRTVYGEARGEGEEGKAAVANVILNRLNEGRFGGSVEAVVKAKHQFEPWNNPKARAKMLELDEGSQKYQEIANIVDSILSGERGDITNGATHFVAPDAQRKLGRQMPKWAEQEIASIGGHKFYKVK